MLENYTGNEVVFPSNFNLRIFILKDNEWIEIQDKPADRSKDPVILVLRQPVVFSPLIFNTSHTYYMRVYVFGDMTTPEGIKKVAAFIDFKAGPP